MIVLMTGMLLVKAHAHDNHRLLLYHENAFCDMIITLSMPLHIITKQSVILTNASQFACVKKC